MEPTHSSARRRLASCHLLLTGLAAGLVVVACNTVAGLDELTFTAGSGATGGASQGGGGASGSCELESGADACTACTHSECNVDYCDCMLDELCWQTYHCAKACVPNDVVCERNCAEQYPNGISQTALVIDCAAGRCTSCPSTIPLSNCEECLYRQCPEPVNDCFGSSICFDYALCYFECYGDATCIEGCGVEFPLAVALFSPVIVCGQTHCYAPCL